MILERLSLFNFGPYKGHHSIEFPPPDSKKPILLIGGLNGEGKTTILEALQLVLYGRQSWHWNSGRDSYYAYLSGAIHRRVPKAEGAQIELVFLSDLDGHHLEYRIQRSWSLTGKKVNEHVQVFLDGHLDADISDRWAEEVHRHLPPQLAALFFFDGEKIEHLADPVRSQQVLDEALKGFMGLDLLDQLDTDLSTIVRRASNGLSGEQGESLALSTAIAEADALVEKSKDNVRGLKEERATLLGKHDQASKRSEQLESEFGAKGGELYLQRVELETQRTRQQTEQVAIEDQMRELAAGCLPLALVTDQLERVHARDKKEDKTRRARDLERPLQEIETAVLDISETAQNPGMTEQLGGFFRDYRAAVAAEAGQKLILNLSKGASSQLESLLQGQLASSIAKAHDLQQQLSGIEGEIQATEGKLSQIPEHEQIVEIIKKRADCSAKLEQINRSLKKADEEIRVGAFHRLEAERKLGKLRERRDREVLQESSAGRSVLHADRAKETLEKFRVKLIERHVERLEQLILEGFNQLLRKKTLVHSLRINPSTRKLVLFSSHSVEIPTSELSAGERQLLAVAILWALARAVGRPLPIVIDTPLGRLDSSHRHNLVDRYFPFASHQITLLSTNTEIDKGLYGRLESNIGASCRVKHSEESDSSSVVDGYFWS